MEFVNRTCKRLVIGDIHGHFDNLKLIYDNEKPNEVIILGDYFDNFHSSDESIIECFENILKLREYHLEHCYGDFIMLLGNHDYHYLNVGTGERYSGWRQSLAPYAYTKLTECIEKGIIKIAQVDTVNKTIFSHAGLTNTWLKTNKLWDVPVQYLEESINKVNLINLRFVGTDMFGNDKKNGPLWVRPEALMFDIFEDAEGYTWTQVVGHTNGFNPVVYKHDGTQCIGTKMNNEYRGHKIPGRKDLSILYVMDCMPNYYFVEEYDYVTEEVVSRDIKRNIFTNE